MVLPPKEYLLLQFVHLANWIPVSNTAHLPDGTDENPFRNGFEACIKGAFLGLQLNAPHLRLLTQKFAIYVFTIFAGVAMPAPNGVHNFRISGMFFSTPPPPRATTILPISFLESGVNPSKTSTGEYPCIIYRIQCLVIGWPSRSVWGFPYICGPGPCLDSRSYFWWCRALIFMPLLLGEITHSLWGKASTPSIEPLGACY